MTPPPGLSCPPDNIFRPCQALYGLKKAPRATFERFNYVIEAVGFTASQHDAKIFVHVSSHGRTILLLYIEDTILNGYDPSHIALFKKQLCYYSSKYRLR